MLHRIVLEHFETFRAQAASIRDGDGLPRFVEQEFRDFLGCGCLASGFARFHCDACGLDRLVPFSCKGRGFCPSCGGRRMAERAAHLIDHVFPDVPVRQWVLSVPYRLRYVLAWDHDVCRAVVAVYVRARLGFLRRRARRDGVKDGHGGAVAIIQRFGGALNLNVHVHALVIDGVFTGEGEAVGFHSARRFPRDEVAQVVAVVARRIDRLLQRRGVAAAPEERGVPDAWAEDTPVLAGLAAASIHGRIGLGPRAAAGVLRYGEPPDDREPAAVGPCHAQVGGFDLHAAIVTRAGQRDRLERLCRYALRPPLAEDRLAVDGEGVVWLTLRHRRSDGTTHLKFEPLELLERLAVLTPRPRINLVLYYGVLAPRARWRAAAVAWTRPPQAGSSPATQDATGDAQRPDAASRGRPGAYLWAELMRRTFGFDVLACPGCGGRLRLLALIEHRTAVERILRHLGLPIDRPEPWPARAPPTRTDAFARAWDEDTPTFDATF